MRIKLLIIIILLLASTVHAADWKEITAKYTWDRRATQFCKEASQCLVSPSGKEAYDNQPNRYWTETSNINKPKCIANGQYIADNYCENGIWSSRTKLVATQLLAIALNATPTNFALFCDKYDSVLNRYAYSTDYGTVTSFLNVLCKPAGTGLNEICANNICVMKYGQNTAFGLSFNTDISGAKSPLQALNMSPDECDSAKNADGDYDACGNGLWYNHDTQSIIHTGDLNPPPAPTTAINDYFILPYNKLKDYVFTYVHKPDIIRYNYTFFNLPPQFQKIYLAKEDFDFAYSFKQEKIGLTQITYAGWYFSNINLPEDACNRIIKRNDSWANCEIQPSPAEFYIAAHRTPPTKLDKRPSLVDGWEEMLKIRVSP